MYQVFQGLFLGVLAFSALAGAAPFQQRASVPEDDEISRPEATSQLLKWELGQLGQNGLDGLLRASLTDLGRLHPERALALARWARLVKQGLRVKNEKDALRELVRREFDLFEKRGPKDELDVLSFLSPALRKRLGNPKSNEDLLKRLNKPEIQPTDLLDLWGHARASRFSQNPNPFSAEFEADRLNTAFYRQNLNPLGPAQAPSVIQPSLPSTQTFTSITPNPGALGGATVQGPISIIMDQDAEGRATPARSAGNGVIAFSQMPTEAKLTDDQIRKLQSGTSFWPSFQFLTNYASKPGMRSTCQGTLIENPNDELERIGSLCTYTMATARHCVVEENGGRPEWFQQIHIPQMPVLFSIVSTQVDYESGGDMAMVRFQSGCGSPLPKVHLASGRPRDGSAIRVYGREALVGQASSVGGRDNLMMMNLRVDGNADPNIYQGNSGGAVLNDQGELVGVISSKIDSPDFWGIGFFASKRSLDWANTEIGQGRPEFAGTPHQATSVAAKPSHNSVVQR